MGFRLLGPEFRVSGLGSRAYPQALRSHNLRPFGSKDTIQGCWAVLGPKP